MLKKISKKGENDNNYGWTSLHLFAASSDTAPRRGLLEDMSLLTPAEIFKSPALAEIQAFFKKLPVIQRARWVSAAGLLKRPVPLPCPR